MDHRWERGQYRGSENDQRWEHKHRQVGGLHLVEQRLMHALIAIQVAFCLRERQYRRGGSQLVLPELPPAEDGVGAERIEPCDDSDVAALVAP
jgi:hypothetical protein